MRRLKLKFHVFGSSLLSSFWNGAATYYRGIYKYLHARGHEVVFYEPDAFERQHHRDLEQVPYAESVVYGDRAELERCLARTAEADVIIKHSGIGVEDAFLAGAVPEAAQAAGHRRLCVFWDVDAPATLGELWNHRDTRLAKSLPAYDLVLTYGGGARVVREYCALGARACYPIYNALDPETHFPVTPQPRWRAKMAFLGHRLPDREERVERFFFQTARALPQFQFLLGGEGWQGHGIPPNVTYVGHVASTEHNVANCSAETVLNINRNSMADYGFSPPTRIFEAAGAAACVITDPWQGLEQFFTPGNEILQIEDSLQLQLILQSLTLGQARQIGELMRRRALLEHTYAQRARQAEFILLRHGAWRRSPALIEAA